MTGIYIHIPFCKQACSYCDFYFVTRTRQKAEFVETLTKEIAASNKGGPFDRNISTIYFGGGTPSLLSIDEVDRILSSIQENFDVSGLQEVTFEMNPDDVNAEYLRGLSRNGITRVSMGVQTFNTERLKFMNRAHSREEALKSLELLHNSPLDSFNVDLIYGNPAQTVEDLEEDVSTLLKFDPPHVSAYALTIEPRTRLGFMNKKGILKAADDDMVAMHIDYLLEKLATSNIHRYEVSNYARPGHEAMHNSAYWGHINYIGYGPAAHSFLWKDDASHAFRWKNTANLKAYLSNECKTDENSVEKLTLGNLAEERLMMGLRTRDGISINQLKDQYEYRFSEMQKKYLQKVSKEGYVTVDKSLRVTDKGLKIADTIITSLL
ncbi:MAG: radical SAM family heme chaperone HemW [Balneolales bacterium]